jgi:hypothetical protein
VGGTRAYLAAAPFLVLGDLSVWISIRLEQSKE